MLDHIRQRQQQLAKNIQSSYIGERMDQMELEKAATETFEKGDRGATIGEIRKFGGRDYIKTTDGWKFHGKGTATKTKQHVAGTKKSTPEVDNSDKHPLIGKHVNVLNHKDLPISLMKLGGQKLEVVGTEKGTLTVPQYLKVKDKDGEIHSINPNYVSQTVSSENIPHKEKYDKLLNQYDAAYKQYRQNPNGGNADLISNLRAMLKRHGSDNMGYSNVKMDNDMQAIADKNKKVDTVQSSTSQVNPEDHYIENYSAKHPHTIDTLDPDSQEKKFKKGDIVNVNGKKFTVGKHIEDGIHSLDSIN